jgi:transposase
VPWPVRGRPRRLRQWPALLRLAAGRHGRQEPALAKAGVKLGPISKRGNGYLRRLLVNGAMSVLCSKQAKQDPWLVKLLETKERKVAACALANKMARIG